MSSNGGLIIVVAVLLTVLGCSEQPREAGTVAGSSGTTQAGKYPPWFHPIGEDQPSSASGALANRFELHDLQDGSYHGTVLLDRETGRIWQPITIYNGQTLGGFQEVDVTPMPLGAPTLPKKLNKDGLEIIRPAPSGSLGSPSARVDPPIKTAAQWLQEYGALKGPCAEKMYTESDLKATMTKYDLTRAAAVTALQNNGWNLVPDAQLAACEK
jgi:hypothetical protein